MLLIFFSLSTNFLFRYKRKYAMLKCILFFLTKIGSMLENTFNRMHTMILLSFFFITTHLFSAFDTTELQKQNAAFKRIKTCKIKSVPYFYTGNASFSGRACAAMTLSTILSPEVITVKDINIKFSGFNDDIVALGQIYRILGVDHFKWNVFSSFEEIKREIEKKHLVTIEGFFDLDHSRYEDSTNKILVIGFDQWGLIVHDPCGKWLGYRDRAYSRAPEEHRDSFAGKHSLYLYKDLQKLLADGALISWTTAWMDHDENVNLKNDFAK